MGNTEVPSSEVQFCQHLICPVRFQCVFTVAVCKHILAVGTMSWLILDVYDPVSREGYIRAKYSSSNHK